MYDNFITLHIAIRLLTNPDRALNLATLNVAQELLTDFVNSFTAIYGSRYVSHNVHNILHVVEDVKKFGILDNFSAIDFDSFIFFIKKLLCKHNQCLAQIVRRCSELDELSNGIIKQKKQLILTADCEYIHKKGSICETLMGGKQYKRYRNNFITLSCDDDRNNCAVLDNSIYIRCLNFIKKSEEIYVVGRKFIYEKDIFSEPRSSMDVGSYLASESEEL